MVTERLVSGGVSGFKVVLAPDAGSWDASGHQKLSYYGIRVQKKKIQTSGDTLNASASSIWLSQSCVTSFWIQCGVDASCAPVDHHKPSGSFVLWYETAEKRFQKSDITSHAFTKAKSVVSIAYSCDPDRDQ